MEKIVALLGGLLVLLLLGTVWFALPAAESALGQSVFSIGRVFLVLTAGAVVLLMIGPWLAPVDDLGD